MMNAAKKKALEAVGWRFGDAEEFLGEEPKPSVGDRIIQRLREFTEALERGEVKIRQPHRKKVL